MSDEDPFAPEQVGMVEARYWEHEDRCEDVLRLVKTVRSLAAAEARLERVRAKCRELRDLYRRQDTPTAGDRLGVLLSIEAALDGKEER
jgi:hypothetical protein